MRDAKDKRHAVVIGSTAIEIAADEKPGTGMHPACAAWKCTCDGLRQSYGVVTNVTFGTAPDVAKHWWATNSCDLASTEAATVPATHTTNESTIEAALDKVAPSPVQSAAAIISPASKAHSPQVQPSHLLTKHVNLSDPHQVNLTNPEEQKAPAALTDRKSPAKQAVDIQCAAWKCSCNEMRKRYGVLTGVTFGAAPDDAKKWWVKKTCDLTDPEEQTAPAALTDLESTAEAAVEMHQGCAAWYCSCSEMRKRYGVVTDVTFGAAPGHAKQWWTENSCDLTNPEAHATPAVLLEEDHQFLPHNEVAPSHGPKKLFKLFPAGRARRFKTIASVARRKLIPSPSAAKPSASIPLTQPAIAQRVFAQPALAQTANLQPAVPQPAQPLVVQHVAIPKDILTEIESDEKPGAGGKNADCAAWKCACEQMRQQYGVITNVTYGIAPDVAKYWWATNSCDKPLAASKAATVAATNVTQTNPVEAALDKVAPSPVSKAAAVISPVSKAQPPKVPPSPPLTKHVDLKSTVEQAAEKSTAKKAEETSCTAWDCSCDVLRQRFGVITNVTFGAAPDDAKHWWAKKSCDLTKEAAPAAQLTQHASLKDKVAPSPVPKQSAIVSPDGKTQPLKSQPSPPAAKELASISSTQPANAQRAAMAQPTVAKPAKAQPAVAQRAQPAQPVMVQPAAVQPVVAQPAVAQPGVAQPAVAQPAAAQPAVAQPAQPVEVQPAAAQPVVAQPVAAQPAAVSEPVVVQPAADPTQQSRSAAAAPSDYPVPEAIPVQSDAPLAPAGQAAAGATLWTKVALWLWFLTVAVLCVNRFSTSSLVPATSSLKEAVWRRISFTGPAADQSPTNRAYTRQSTAAPREASSPAAAAQTTS